MRHDGLLFLALLVFIFTFVAFATFDDVIAKILEFVACIGSFTIIVVLARHNYNHDNNSKVTQNKPKDLYTFKNGDKEMTFNRSERLHNHE